MEEVEECRAGRRRWGRRDRSADSDPVGEKIDIPIEQAKLWASFGSSQRVETFEGAGHLLFFEAPEAVGRTGSFLANDRPMRKAAG